VGQPVIADAFALDAKTKNFHWDVCGPHFNNYHHMFDEQAEAILESIDEMAERARKIGARQSGASATSVNCRPLKTTTTTWCHRRRW
jgi:DNA-binding ferritin-like protein